MKIEEIMKLDRKLGEYYCLYPLPNDGWTLGRTGSQREIMSSDKNTKEELLEFVKEHRVYDMKRSVSTTCLILNSVWLLIIIANFFIKSKILMCMSWGVLITLLPILFVIDLVMKNNEKTLDKVCNEDVEYFNKLQSQKVVENIIKHQKMEAEHAKHTGRKTTVKTKIQTIKGENTTVTRKKVRSTETSTRKPRTKVEEKKEV